MSPSLKTSFSGPWVRHCGCEFRLHHAALPQIESAPRRGPLVPSTRAQGTGVATPEPNARRLVGSSTTPAGIEGGYTRSITCRHSPMLLWRGERRTTPELAGASTAATTALLVPASCPSPALCFASRPRLPCRTHSRGRPRTPSPLFRAQAGSPRAS